MRLVEATESGWKCGGGRSVRVDDEDVDWLRRKRNGEVKEVRTDKGKEMAQKERLGVASTHRKQARNGGGRRNSGE